MSSFKTIELSDPRFERDGLRHVTVKTPNLQGRGNVLLYVPPSEYLVGKNIPIVILLHGVYGSAGVWAMKAGAHLTAQKMMVVEKKVPFILAMPSDGLWGDGSGYAKHSGKDFEKWIVEDVPQAVQEAVPQTSAQSPIFMAGLSMGGYGALRLGAKFSKKFKAISGHSSITRWEEMDLFVEENISTFAPAEKEQDLIDIFIKNKKELPPFRFDCGREDDLIEGNRLFHQQLLEADIAHQYEEFSGGHEWIYWETHLVNTLLFFQKFMFTPKP